MDCWLEGGWKCGRSSGGPSGPAGLQRRRGVLGQGGVGGLIFYSCCKGKCIHESSLLSTKSTPSKLWDQMWATVCRSDYFTQLLCKHFWKEPISLWNYHLNVEKDQEAFIRGKQKCLQHKYKRANFLVIIPVPQKWGFDVTFQQVLQD